MAFKVQATVKAISLIWRMYIYSTINAVKMSYFKFRHELMNRNSGVSSRFHTPACMTVVYIRLYSL